MASISVAPRILKNMSVSIGDPAGTPDNFEAAIASLKFTPSTSIATWKGGTPSAVFTDMGYPTWVCDMKLAQDWATSGSLALYLLNNQLVSRQCVFRPYGGTSGPKVTATLILAPPEVGGDIDSWLETTIQHAVSGVPVFAAT